MLYTSRTPLRVSFFGGGTDYPEYFSRHPGAVVGMAINKYVYISALKLFNFINYKYRLSYSKLELASEHSEIEHPVVRCILDHYGISDALDINVMADLPASSGLGSSSAFTVGLINLVSALRSKPLTRLDLAQAAIHVERDLLMERVGVQDQLHTSFGGLNRFDFVDGRTRITPIQMHTASSEALMSSLVLVYTGVTRYASKVLKEQLDATKEKKVDTELSHLIKLTDECVSLLESDNPGAMLTQFGEMMHEGWETKRKLSASVSSPAIDELYDHCRASGAIGGKLCGAGGGGFLLMVVPPENRAMFLSSVTGNTIIPIKLDAQGSVVMNGS
ncbi:galactokinase [Roseibium aquae]|uniref:Galactokinase n=2 Tax=Roseibium aquae TaxID=1323746 RepID=A0A916TNH5_9HYPH|nr:galactokinase [Roseibium aquae]